MLTLHLRAVSGAAFTTYVLAVEPAHACSLSVMVPQPALLLAPAVPTTRTAPAAIAAPPATAPARRDRREQPATFRRLPSDPIRHSFLLREWHLRLLPCAHPALGDA